MAETKNTEELMTAVMTAAGVVASLGTSEFLSEEETSVLEDSVHKFIPDDPEEAAEVAVGIVRDCVANLKAELAKEGG